MDVFLAGLPCGGAVRKRGAPALPCGAGTTRPQRPEARASGPMINITQRRWYEPTFEHGYWQCPGPVTPPIETLLKYNELQPINYYKAHPRTQPAYKTTVNNHYKARSEK